MKDISISINKVDNISKISGQETYIADLQLEDVYYGKTLRSTICRGKITKKDYPKLPEDYYIVDASDIPGKNFIKMNYEDWQVFADSSVNFYGEPIALIIGKDLSIIKEIMQAINIEYEEEEPVFGAKDIALDYEFSKGKDRQSLDSQGCLYIEETFKTGYQEHVYIETQGMIGYYQDERIQLIGSMQCPYYVKGAVRSILALNDDEKDVRIRQSSTGGGFGGKEDYPSVLACQLAVAVYKLHKTVKIIFERSEDIQFTTKRHPAKTRINAMVTPDGYIKHLDVHVGLDGGAYIGLSNVVLQRALINANGVYVFDNTHVWGEVYRTNTVPNGAFRGFGAPQVFFAIEQFMEHLAKRFHIDPIDYRKRYLAKQGDKTSTSGSFRDPILMETMIDKAMSMSDYKAKLIKYAKENADPRSKVYKGIGMSWFLHGCGFTGSGEQEIIKAIVKLHKTSEDDVDILVACVDMGQGIKTTLRKVVAHELELPLEKIHLNNPDTDLVPDSGPTVASRTMMVVGGLVLEATKTLKKEWKDGQDQWVKRQYKQPEFIQWDQTTFTGDAYPAYSWGVNIVEVEINRFTYQPKLVGAWAVFDVGKAIDERIVKGQIEGGMLQGISYGFLEVMNHKDGIIQQKNVTDYIIPTAKDAVPIQSIIVENPFAYGPYGAKGVGELTLIGGAPAVANAIEHAMSLPLNQIPVTPEYIMEVKHHEG